MINKLFGFFGYVRIPKEAIAHSVFMEGLIKDSIDAAQEDTCRLCGGATRLNLYMSLLLQQEEMTCLLKAARKAGR